MAIPPSDSLFADEVGDGRVGVRVVVGADAAAAAVSVGGGAATEHLLVVNPRAREAVVPFAEAVHVAGTEGILAQN